MSVGDGRRGRRLAWCSAALSTVAIAGMGVSAATAQEAGPREDLPTGMVRLADGNSGAVCTSTTATPTTTSPDPTTTTTEPTTTTTSPDPTTTTATSCAPPKGHGDHGKSEHGEKGHGEKGHGHGGKEHAGHGGGHEGRPPSCRSAAPSSDPLHGLLGLGVG